MEEQLINTESEENIENNASGDSKFAINARREARRKRILENMNNRLTKITGREHNEEIPVEPVPINDIIYDDPEIERDIYEAQEAPPMFRTMDGDIDPMEFLNQLRSQTMGANSEQAQQQQQPEVSKLGKILATRIHLIVTSILVYILFITGKQSYTSDNVFLFLLLWETAEVFILKTYIPKQSSMVGIIFLLSGVPNTLTSGLFKAFETLNKILRDVAVYIFFFVVSHFMWQTIGMGRGMSEILRTNLV